jgi:hypothetical protein
MRTLLIINFLIILFAKTSEGQNQSTRAGLKFGSWTDTLDNTIKGKDITIGKYVIIPINSYPIIRKSNADFFYKVKYLNGSTYIFYSAIVNDSFSVADGIWNRFDSSSNLVGSDIWNKGIILSSKEFNSTGQLRYFDTSDYMTNQFISYHYIDDRLFSKKKSSLNSNKKEVYDYYPNDKLVINNAEPDFTSDFLKKPIDTLKLILHAQDDIEVINIKDSTNNFTFLDKYKKPITSPFKISKSSKIPIYILFKPSPSSLRSTETITLTTNELAGKEYSIYAKTDGYHLNYESVEKISAFSLSISRDKYLILPPMGTVTSTSITWPDGKVTNYIINETTKIDLSDFKPGKYHINTLACNAGGSQTMILVK